MPSRFSHPAHSGGFIKGLPERRHAADEKDRSAQILIGNLT
jgi:hypothetical protein